MPKPQLKPPNLHSAVERATQRVLAENSDPASQPNKRLGRPPVRDSIHLNPKWRTVTHYMEVDKHTDAAIVLLNKKRAGTLTPDIRDMSQLLNTLLGRWLEEQKAQEAQ